MSEETLNRVRALIIPILSDAGTELVDIEYRRESRGWVLRIYIDREDGVTLDDCTRVSQEVGRTLDVEDFISNPYTLEVSSPGLRRPLRNEKDFEKYQDRWVKVKTLEPVENRRQFRGKLLGMIDHRIELETEGRVFRIALSNVAKANLEIES
jgi:ribosome maturation factor RimP